MLRPRRCGRPGNVPPTIRVPQGGRMQVLVARDVSFAAVYALVAALIAAVTRRRWSDGHCGCERRDAQRVGSGSCARVPGDGSVGAGAVRGAAQAVARRRVGDGDLHQSTGRGLRRAGVRVAAGADAVCDGTVVSAVREAGGGVDPAAGECRVAAAVGVAADGRARAGGAAAGGQCRDRGDHDPAAERPGVGAR